MRRWIPERTGAAYERAGALGGFRRTSPQSRNIGLRHPAFRGYADYMETPPFREAVNALLDHARATQTAIMCSESLWWRCHRRLVADAATLLYRVEVRHLMHDGSLKEHVPTAGVRVTSDGVLRYDPL